MIFYKNKVLKVYLYGFYERPKTKLSYIYHVFTLLLILINAFLGVILTMKEYENDDNMNTAMFWYELALLVLFSMEYIVRLIVCDVNSKYRGFKGRLLYMRSFYMLIDLFVIITAMVTSILQTNSSYFNVLRFARFFQIFRILRFDRSRGDLHIMWKVVSEHKKELITCYFFCFLVLFLGSYIIYMVEKTEEFVDGGINNMVNGLYWGLITFTTVGYGDYSPRSWAGKILTGLFSLVGCAFFALPAGIIGSGFALQVSKQKKEKSEIKIRIPAARLIQATWRYYAISEGHLKATWYYMLPQLRLAENAMQEDIGSQRSSFTIETDVNDNEGVKIRNKKVSEQRSIVSLVQGVIQPERQFHIPTFKKKRQPIYVSPIEMLGVIENVYADENTCLVNLLGEKFRITIKFILILKLNKAVKVMSRTRQPYINIEELLHTSITSVTDTSNQVKELKDQFQVLLEEQQCLRDDVSKIVYLLESKFPKDSCVVGEEIDK